MKKFIITSALVALSCASANAQNANSENSSQKHSEKMLLKNEQQKSGSQFAQNDEKKREFAGDKGREFGQDKHREFMESLTEEQRQLVKKEMERHFAEMKKITGKDFPPHKNGNEGGARGGEKGQMKPQIDGSKKPSQNSGQQPQ